MALHDRTAVELSWAKTPDRSARTAPARSASPTGLDYWLARLDPCMDKADPETRAKAAEHLRRAYYARLSAQGVAARRAARARGAS